MTAPNNVTGSKGNPTTGLAGATFAAANRLAVVESRSRWVNDVNTSNGRGTTGSTGAVGTSSPVWIVDEAGGTTINGGGALTVGALGVADPVVPSAAVTKGVSAS
ncbi:MULTISPECIES: hypothetical protein [unclassified Mycobacterium]|uniref:hypothetical protein n=1 Tax=unclassified Mycobacterium TaxID=2642494 RepID=UPI0029C8D446|nr:MULTISPECIES: hypothetical protein [unclassified Mycobacterium]